MSLAIGGLGRTVPSPIRQTITTVSSADASIAIGGLQPSGITARFLNPLASALSRVRIRVHLSVGGSTIQTAIAAITRNGVSVVPAGRDYLATAVIGGADYSNILAFEFIDSPNATETALYEITYGRATAGTLRINHLSAAGYKCTSSLTLEELI